MDEIEQAIAVAIREAVKSVAPEGVQVWVGGTPLSLIEVGISCPHRDIGMGYHCGLRPGHPGECFDFNKKVDFWPFEGE